MSFAIGKRYSRREISNMLGGNMRSYLPTRQGVVVCGCFHRSDKLNPDAPDEIVFGCGPDVIRGAERVASQRQPIPVFLFKGALAWEYVGNYVCVAIDRSAAAIAYGSRRVPRRNGNVCGILRFELSGGS
jgi:hypothetical protein